MAHDDLTQELNKASQKRQETVTLNTNTKVTLQQDLDQVRTPTQSKDLVREVQVLRSHDSVQQETDNQISYPEIFPQQDYQPTILDDLVNAVADKIKQLEQATLKKLENSNSIQPLTPIAKRRKRKLTSSFERSILNELAAEPLRTEDIIADLPDRLEERIEEKTAQFDEVSILEKQELLRKLKQRRQSALAIHRDNEF